MRPLLSPVLAFHWMVVFGMLAIVSAISPGRGTFVALELLGVSFLNPFEQGSVRFSALLSLGFMVVTALFLWTLISSILGTDRRGDAEETSRYAFGAAVVALTALLMVGAVQPVEGLFVAIGTLLSGLVVSYLAIFAERYSAALAAQPQETDAGARTMASRAAQQAMLSRISGRPAPAGEERRP